MILANILDKGKRVFPSLIARAWVISLGLFTIIPFFVTYLTGQPFLAKGFTVLSLLFSCGGYFWNRRHNLSLRWIYLENRFALAAGVFLPIVIMFLFAPKFFSEELNGDATHVYVTARSFVYTLLPTIPHEHGSLMLYPVTVIGEIFSASTFLRFFPEDPYSIRLAFIWGMTLVVPFLIVLIKGYRTTRIGPASRAAIVVALLAYAILLAYQTSYDPYFADIGSPGGREPFVVLGFLALTHFFHNRNLYSTMLFSVLVSISTPAAPVLITAYLLSIAILRRPIDRKWIVGNFVFLVFIQIFLQLLPGFIGFLVGTTDVNEFGVSGIARRLRFLTIQSPDRLLYWVFPCGILPGLSILLWKKMDLLSKELLLSMWAYTLFFLFQAYRVLPHHFAPVVLVSLVIFWRTIVNTKNSQWLAVPGLVGAAIGLFLSFPLTWDVHTTGRDLASRFGWHPDFESVSYETKLAMVIPLTTEAFKIGNAPTSYGEEYIVSPLAIASQASMVTGDERADYYFQPVDAEPNPEFPDILVSNKVASLAVRDR